MPHYYYALIYAAWKIGAILPAGPARAKRVLLREAALHAGRTALPGGS